MQALLLSLQLPPKALQLLRGSTAGPAAAVRNAQQAFGHTLKGTLVCAGAATIPSAAGESAAAGEGLQLPLHQRLPSMHTKHEL